MTLATDALVPEEEEAPAHPPHALLPLVVGALGVVYGDIGTSPLYAVRESFHHNHLAPSAVNVLGVLSLIIWSLAFLICVKYLLFVMRADNRGDGGILDEPDVPQELARLRTEGGKPFMTEDTTFFLGRETVIPVKEGGMALWRERLFVFLSRNAKDATSFYRIPPERVVELGLQVVM